MWGQPRGHLELSELDQGSDGRGTQTSQCTGSRWGLNQQLQEPHKPYWEVLTLIKEKWTGNKEKDRKAWRAAVYGVAELDKTKWMNDSRQRELGRQWRKSSSVWVCMCVSACSPVCIHDLIRWFSLRKQCLLLLSLSLGSFYNEERLRRERGRADGKWF